MQFQKVMKLVYVCMHNYIYIPYPFFQAIEKSLKDNTKDVKKISLARKPIASVNRKVVLKPVKELIALRKKSPNKNEILIPKVVGKEVSNSKVQVKEVSFNDSVVLSSQELQDKLKLEELLLREIIFNLLEIRTYFVLIKKILSLVKLVFCSKN